MLETSPLPLAGEGGAKRRVRVFLEMERRNLNSTKRARSLRRDETEAEVRLWECLRDRRLNGYKFVRQLPITHYFADFACRSGRLIVEVDGATHCSEAEVSYDEKRTKDIEALGWRVLRVWNEDVFKSLNVVCDAIVLALEERPPSSALRAPSPASGRRR